jgi:hypothetical protein
MPTSDKLTLGEKLCYGCGDFACVLCWQTLRVFLPILYIDVFGIPAGAAGAGILFSRLLDGAVDPAVGIVITDGEHGSSAYSAGSAVMVPGFAVTAVDTTGCGDEFLAGLLHQVLRLRGDPGRLSRETLVAVCRYANAVGALNSLKHGASAAMPTGDEVKQFLASREGG